MIARIVVKESTRVRPVCANAANNRSHMNQDVRAMLIEQAFNRINAR
jgi:hypothetical protein